MRVAVALLLIGLAPAVASERTLSSRFPAGAHAYVEVRGLSGKLDAVLASPLGQAVKTHPAMQRFLLSEKGRGIIMGEFMLRGATGMGYKELLAAVASRELGVALYGETPLAIARMDGESAERLAAGVETLSGGKRVTIVGGEDGGPVLWQLDKAFGFHDGERLVVSTGRHLVEAVRNGTAKGIDLGDALRLANGDKLLFAVLDLDRYRKELKEDKPKDLGEAILLGVFPHYLPDAPWAALSLDVQPRGEGWVLAAEGVVPLPEQPEEAVESALGGTLGALPFTPPESTVGLIRMRRDLSAMWAHKDALIAERGIPKLVEFETNFGNLTAGMSWVEEFLPRVGDELIVLAIRPVFAEGEPSPAVRFPQAALVWPMKNAGDIAARIEIAFQAVVAFVNFDAAQMGGTALVLRPETYKGTRIIAAQYLPPSDAEMADRKTLPPRYNLAPAAAVVGEHLVIATNDEIVKLIVDRYGQPFQAPEGVNAGIWLHSRNARALLAENREPLIANTMLEEGLDRKAAEERIDFILAVARLVRDFELTAHESRASVGLRLQVEVALPEG